MCVCAVKIGVVCPFYAAVQVDTVKNYIEIFSYTAKCNWLDVVEIYFRSGNDSGEIIDCFITNSFSLCSTLLGYLESHQNMECYL